VLPIIVSAPTPPSITLFPEFPVKTLSKELPVILISLVPERVAFSTLLSVVYDKEAMTVSIPSSVNSTIVSSALSTMYVSLPNPPSN